GHEPISDAARNHDVVFGAVSLFAEHAFNRASAFKHKDNLVGATVPVILEFTVCFLRPAAICGHVLIEQDRDPSGINVAETWNLRRLQMMMSERTIGDFL